MKFTFSFGGGHHRRGGRRYRHYGPGLYVTLGPRGSAIMCVFMIVIGAFCCLLSLLGNFFMTIIGALFIIFGIIGYKSNIRQVRREKEREKENFEDEEK